MLNLFSDELRRDPYPVYDQIRSTSPILYEPRSGFWMIFDYEGTKQALGDQDAFSSDLRHTADHPTPEWLVFFDPPRHTKLRALITRAFTPRMVANLEPRIRQLAREFLDKTIERGEMDLADDLTVPLPMMVILYAAKSETSSNS